MKRLHVGLVVKNQPVNYERDNRNKGFFSYDVPDFCWSHFFFGKSFRVDTAELKATQRLDLIMHEDGGNWGEYASGALPIAMLVYDATASEGHYIQRLEQAAKADLILLDHDPLERFEVTGRPTYRMCYCVNDRLFKDRRLERTTDIAYHCGRKYSPERQRLRDMLAELSERRGYVFRDEPLPTIEYAMSMASAKIVVNWPQTPTNRPHRVFDAMACGACLVTGKLPDVSGDLRIAGEDYEEADTLGELIERVDALLQNGKWKGVAASSNELVMKNHTWAIRARQLRSVIETVLGI